MKNARVLDAVLGQAWAIVPEWLDLISAVAQRQFDAPAVAAMRGNPARAGAAGLTVVDGVAVVGLIGPIFPRANMMTENSGATSLEMVRAEFMSALGNADVRAIVLHIDSPGGVASGIGEFADEVFAARSRKPIVAVATGQMCSAAYWIGAAASRVVVSPSATVGSIGVVAGMSKQVAPDQNGDMAFEIVSSNAPNKRPDPADSAGRAAIVAHVDALETLFIAGIAKFRGAAVATVKADFGQGGVMLGAQAVAAGMADKIDTLDSVLTGLAAASPAKSSPPRAAAAASSEHNRMTTPASVAELTAAFPDLVAEIRREASAGTSTARAEGAAAERARLAGIESAALPGHDKLVAECKADPACTPGDAALRINAAEKAKLGAQHQAIQDVENVTGRVAAAPSATHAPAATATVIQNTEGWKAEFAKSEQLQGEFATADAYANYMQGVKDGRIRVLKARA